MLSNSVQDKTRKTLAKCLGLSLVTLGLALAACGTVETDNSPLAAATATRSTSIPSSPTRSKVSATSTPATSIIAGTPSANSIITSPTNSPLTPIALKDWKQRWLKGIPCRAPCWENITPGKTTLEEAIKLLEANPAVRPGSIAVLSKPQGITFPKGGELSWKWIDNDVQVSKIKFDEQNTQIVLEIGFAAFEFKLGDIIQAYGEPTHVIADKLPEVSSIGFLWFSQGFGGGVVNDKEPILDASLTVRLNKFFIPTTPQKYVKEGGVLGAEQFIPWQGYKDFKFYCTASMPSHRCG